MVFKKAYGIHTVQIWVFMCNNVLLFFIQCSKSVNFCVCQKYPNKELHPDGKESLWDARTGFTVPSHLISYAGVVSCQTRIGNETFKSPLYIVAVVGKKSRGNRMNTMSE